MLEQRVSLAWYNACMSKHPKRPKDPNELAKLIADIAVGSAEEDQIKKDDKNPAAVELGRLGGKKGGVARAKKLSPEERKAIAQKAAKARWEKTE